MDDTDTRSASLVVRGNGHKGFDDDKGLRTARGERIPLIETYKSIEPHTLFVPGTLDYEELQNNHFLLDRHLLHQSGLLERLKGITNIFSPQIEGVTSRYTHSVQVANLAAVAARGLRMNPVLAETIGLGHDCAHGPGGHIFEDTMLAIFGNQYNHGYLGNKLLQHFSKDFHKEVLDGIKNHSWKCETPMTAEGEIVAWADRIAYIISDFLDGCTLGIVSPQDLLDDQTIDREIARLIGTDPESLREFFIDRLIQDSRSAGYVAMNARIARSLMGLRDFNTTRIIGSQHRVDHDDLFHRAIAEVVHELTCKKFAPPNTHKLTAPFPRVIELLLRHDDASFLEYHRALLGDHAISRTL
ncbi:MAG TPA: HD domain-containing protein [Acidimicrobiia bacterium]|nr:HD domain-containing protein [Acidimicrobiia bacterium]